MDYKIILASGSPRRRELLGLLGFNFTVAPSIEVKESYPSEILAEDVAPYLSRLKAEAYRKTIKNCELMITADTVVISPAGEVLGKPSSLDDARRMLHSLSGHTHKVVTGVCAFTKDIFETTSAVTEVDFAPLSDEEIDYYVNTFRPLDKAGAYGIQEWIGAIGVSGIRGSFYNVMGLPLQRLYSLLSDRFGIKPSIT